MSINKFSLNLVCLLQLLFATTLLAADGPTVSPTVAEFSKGMQHLPGYYDVYYQNEQDKVYLLIKQTSQPFLLQTSLPQGVGSNDIGLDRGQLGETRLVQFERFGNKVMLKQLNTAFRVSSANLAEQASIDEAFADSVIAGFTVVAEDKQGLLVDYTEFLLSDIHHISTQLSDTKQGDYRVDPKRSAVYMPRTKSFVDNTELEALVTYAGSKPGEFVKQVTPDPLSISVHLHHSLVRLPDDKYQPRRFHPYSGFWKVGYQDYSVAIDENMEQAFIPRHRLLKKNPEAAVSEAVEPIVYYLDPGIPEPIMSALRDGALWWNDAFSAIGYKNAFQVKVLPADADPMDVHYNVIQWVHRATRGWSYGGSVIDPRTGEIIKGHVTLGSLRVRQDYMIALGLTSPFTEDNTDSSAQKAMALARIRQLSAHEVGHTLGIAHNFAASIAGRESVMDYPHPLLKVENGKISLDEAYAVGMGEWDKHVIAYGYQQFANEQQEQQAQQTLLQNSRAKGLRFQSDPDARSANTANPYGHLWDNGADPIAEFKHISAVRKIALSNFGLNSIKSGSSLASLEETLVPIYLLHRYQLDALAKLLGGVDYEYELKGDYKEAKGVTAVSGEKQNQALDAMLESMSVDYLTLPAKLVQLITPKAYGDSRSRESFVGRTGITFDPIGAGESAAAYNLSLMLVPERLNRMAQQAASGEGLSVSVMLNKLFKQSIQQRGDKAHMQLQQRINYVVLDSVMNSLAQPELAPEVRGEILMQVEELHQWLGKQRDPQHASMAKLLSWYWQSGEWKSPFQAKPLPPGSPI
jgi:hypothetical protein